MAHADSHGHPPPQFGEAGAHVHVHHPAHQHHFETMEQQAEAATLGMWLFLVTEVMFFGGLFMAYVVYRNAFFHDFEEGSRALDVSMGAINTVVLICSSLTMALAVFYAQTGSRRMQPPAGEQPPCQLSV